MFINSIDKNTVGKIIKFKVNINLNIQCTIVQIIKKINYYMY